MGVIYKATCLVTGKSYIGKSVYSLLKRKRGHETDAFNNSNFLFHKALRKYKVENFLWEELDNCEDPAELCQLEMKWIAKLKTQYPTGYNLTAGGDGFVNHPRTAEHNANIAKSKLGIKHSKETCKKISEAKIGLPTWNKGKKLTLEHRKAISEAAKNKPPMAESTRKKISLKLKGRPSPNKGKVTSDSTKSKLSQALKGRKKAEFTTEHKTKIRKAQREEIFLSYVGQNKEISEWAKELAIPTSLLLWRYRAGWSIPRLLKKKIKPLRFKFT